MYCTFYLTTVIIAISNTCCCYIYDLHNAVQNTFRVTNLKSKLTANIIGQTIPNSQSTITFTFDFVGIIRKLETIRNTSLELAMPHGSQVLRLVLIPTNSPRVLTACSKLNLNVLSLAIKREMVYLCHV